MVLGLLRSSSEPLAGEVICRAVMEIELVFCTTSRCSIDHKGGKRTSSRCGERDNGSNRELHYEKVLFLR